MNDFRLKGSGQVLRTVREEANVSLRDLADRLGWNQGTLSKYENNQLGVSLEVMEQIADALSCSREELALRCLRERYGSLGKSTTTVGRLASSLIDALAKQAKKGD